MKILIASAEVAPFAKAGGLADVIGALPKELNSLGQDARVIMPLYGCISKETYGLKKVPNSHIEIQLGEELKPVSLYESNLPDSDAKVYFIENEQYFGAHPQVYPQDMHHRFEQERYILFCKATLELMKQINFQANVIHCNDWHTAMIPIYLKNTDQGDFYKNTKTLFSIHNLAYQGWYSSDILDLAGLPKELLTMDKLEFYGDVNWMKGGIYFSDAINTVSKKYAQEIQTQEYGERLEGFLKVHSQKLSGIVNGIDYTIWNPELDSHIESDFSLKQPEGKALCKAKLQDTLDLKISPNTPIISLVSRLVDQKGLDLIEPIADELGNLPAQFIFLGTGSKDHEQSLRNIGEKHANISSIIKFCINLSHNIYAGSDFFLMPSKFEPCGLGQLIAMKYGTLPIARKTGGLADTIIDGKTGFLFEDYNSKELLDTIKRAIKVYNKKSLNFLSHKKPFIKLQNNAMKADFGWNKSAREYIKLYKTL